MTPFFAYARKRQQVLLNRMAGNPWPWTDDPVLRQYRFCNVFRQDDTTTKWIVENLLTPLAKNGGEWNILPVMVAARFINRVETLDALKDILLEEGWHSKAVKAKLQDLKDDGQRLITGAYMIRTPHGINKIEGLDQIISPIQLEAKYGRPFTPFATLEEQWKSLRRFPFLGGFMAYEVVTDLSYAFSYSDTMTWAHAGPGALRGLWRIDGVRRPRHTPEVLEDMRKVLEQSKWSLSWPSEWPSWDMRTVEHTLCEFDKYERARLGEGRPKQKYTYADHNSTQPS